MAKKSNTNCSAAITALPDASKTALPRKESRMAEMRSNGTPLTLNDYAVLCLAKSVVAKLRCGARTRRGTACKRKVLPNGRCPNHGGRSTGPKTKAGRQRIAQAQRARWARWRAQRSTQSP